MKSRFLVPAVVVSTVLGMVALAAALTDDNATIAWVGAVLANAPLPLFWLYLRVGNVTRTSENLPLLMLLSAAGSVIALWETVVTGNEAWKPVAFAFAGTVLLLLYVFWYSRFGRKPNSRLAVGNKLPDFVLTDLDGRSISSKEFLGEPTINIFYRGNWCPFCLAQIREIATRRQDLERLGIQVNFISSQPAEQTRELSIRFEGKGWRFLRDPGAAAAEILGIAEENAAPRASAGESSSSALPTVIVTNAAGTILFSDETDVYRARPEPDIYISILRRAGAARW